MEQVKWAMVESEREVCGSVRVGENNPKSVWWNDEVKAVERRKKAVWKEVLGVRDEEAKERCMEDYREKKDKLEGVYFKAKMR